PEGSWVGSPSSRCGGWGVVLMVGRLPVGSTSPNRDTRYSPLGQVSATRKRAVVGVARVAGPGSNAPWAVRTSTLPLAARSLAVFGVRVAGATLSVKVTSMI